ncbi:hypothetical protein HED49_23240 [Ochrobactrum daejeonense]|nr:hypothetical protein [Brucella daejeonensis]
MMPIVLHTREAMAQDVRRNIGEQGVGEDFLPVIGKLPNAASQSRPGNTYSPAVLALIVQ